MEAAEVQRARGEARVGASEGGRAEGRFRTDSCRRSESSRDGGGAGGERSRREGLGRLKSNALLTNAAAAIVALLARVVVRSRSAARSGEGWPPRGLRSEKEAQTRRGDEFNAVIHARSLWANSPCRGALEDARVVTRVVGRVIARAFVACTQETRA